MYPEVLSVRFLATHRDICAYRRKSPVGFENPPLQLVCNHNKLRQVAPGSLQPKQSEAGRDQPRSDYWPHAHAIGIVQIASLCGQLVTV